MEEHIALGRNLRAAGIVAVSTAAGGGAAAYGLKRCREQEEIERSRWCKIIVAINNGVASGYRGIRNVFWP